MSDLKKLASELRQRLFDQQSLVKQAEQREQGLLKKLASVQTENRILRETLELVSGGMIDPEDVMDRVEEFSRDPNSLEVVKEAFKFGLDRLPSIGTPSSEGASGSKPTPEQELEDTIREMEPALRRNW